MLVANLLRRTAPLAAAFVLALLGGCTVAGSQGCPGGGACAGEAVPGAKAVPGVVGLGMERACAAIERAGYHGGEVVRVVGRDEGGGGSAARGAARRVVAQAPEAGHRDGPELVVYLAVTGPLPDDRLPQGSRCYDTREHYRAFPEEYPPLFGPAGRLPSPSPGAEP